MIVVTGATGQLGFELKRLLADSATFLDQEQLDLRQLDRVESALRELCPSLLINAAAYTQVDRAESEPEIAGLVNTAAPVRMARVARDMGFRFIAISTDYVFDGRASEPYTEQSPVNPQTAYGVTKAEMEAQVLQVCPQALVLRTGWLYSSHGHNFVKTMLRLFQERPSLRVVFDQIGTPTSARDFAQAILQSRELSGLYNYANDGVTSWYDFACAIARSRRLTPRIEPILSEDYPTPAKRPKYTVLDKSLIKSTLNLTIPHWMESLEKCLCEIS